MNDVPADVQQALDDWRAVRRVVVRQLADGTPATKATNMLHKRACDEIARLSKPVASMLGRR